MLSVRKEPPKFVDGVLLSNQMTEKHEKAERAAIMREHGCSEVDAAGIVAERLAASRRGQKV